MSISPRSGVRGLERLVCFKDYILLKWESRFIFWLNAAEITDYIKKLFKQSCRELNFIQKSQWAHMSISPKCGARELERLICIKYYIVLKWESRFTFWPDAAKITDYIRKRPNKSI